MEFVSGITIFVDGAQPDISKNKRFLHLRLNAVTFINTFKLSLNYAYPPFTQRDFHLSIEQRFYVVPCSWSQQQRSVDRQRTHVIYQSSAMARWSSVRPTCSCRMASHARMTWWVSVMIWWHDIDIVIIWWRNVSLLYKLMFHDFVSLCHEVVTWFVIMSWFSDMTCHYDMVWWLT